MPIMFMSQGGLLQENQDMWLLTIGFQVLVMVHGILS